MWRTLALIGAWVLIIGFWIVLTLWLHLVWTMWRSGVRFSRDLEEFRHKHWRGEPRERGTDRAPGEAGAAGRIPVPPPDSRPAARHRLPGIDGTKPGSPTGL